MRKLKVRLMQKEGRSSMPKTNSSKKELDMRSDVPGGEIVLYTAADGTVKLDVQLEKETVWLTQQLMAELFQTTKQNIGQHLKSIFQSGELAQKAVVKKFFTTAADSKSYDTNFYNLDAIISVGYRVKSHVAMQFRIWATNVLRDHLLRGYSVNERRLQELNQAIRLISDVANRRELTGDEATALLRVVGEYSFALDLLDDYDYQRVAAPGPGATVIHALDYDEAVRIVVVEGVDDRGTRTRSSHTLVVIVVQQVECEAVLAHDAQQRCRLISRQLSPIGHVGNQTDSLIELLEAPLVD